MTIYCVNDYEGSQFGPISAVYERGKDVGEVFNSFLGEGYTYSEDPEFVEDSYESITMSWMKQKSISVIKKNSAGDDSSAASSDQSSNSNNQKTSKIKAPKTDDGFLFWLGIIALVMGVLSVTVIVEKNSVKRK